MSEEGMALLADTVTPKGKGDFLVARLDEWMSEAPIITAWRGPEKAEERLPRMRLREITCGKLLVDPKGFWFCTVPDEEIEEVIGPILEKFIQEAAHESLADLWSYDEPFREDFGDDVWVMATFGDATSTNGERLSDDEEPKAPDGYVKTDRGGHIYSEETELDREQFYGPTQHLVELELGRPIPLEQIVKIINKEYPKQWIYWSGSGDSEVWAPASAVEDYENRKRNNRRVTPEEERARREARAEERRQARRRAIEEGKYGAKQDWSPRGQIPGLEMP